MMSITLAHIKESNHMDLAYVTATVIGALTIALGIFNSIKDLKYRKKEESIELYKRYNSLVSKETPTSQEEEDIKRYFYLLTRSDVSLDTINIIMNHDHYPKSFYEVKKYRKRLKSLNKGCLISLENFIFLAFKILVATSLYIIYMYLSCSFAYSYNSFIPSRILDVHYLPWAIVIVNGLMQIIATVLFWRKTGEYAFDISFMMWKLNWIVCKH